MFDWHSTHFIIHQAEQQGLNKYAFNLTNPLTTLIAEMEESDELAGKNSYLVSLFNLREQLAEHSSFVEVCYLLIHGELPNVEQLADWDRALKMHGKVPRDELEKENTQNRRGVVSHDWHHSRLYLKQPDDLGRPGSIFVHFRSARR